MKNLVFCFCVVLLGCNQSEQLRIVDTSEREIFEIQPDTPENYALTIELIGNINGKSVLHIISENSSFKSEIELFGKIDTLLLFDWYQEKGKIIYEPLSVEDGELQIKYTFYD